PAWGRVGRRRGGGGRRILSPCRMGEMTGDGLVAALLGAAAWSVRFAIVPARGRIPCAWD
ncbi:MAG: hypothetical protein AB1816_17890, partial [Bacillota bacterium]